MTFYYMCTFSTPHRYRVQTSFLAFLRCNENTNDQHALSWQKCTVHARALPVPQGQCAVKTSCAAALAQNLMTFACAPRMTVGFGAAFHWLGGGRRTTAAVGAAFQMPLLGTHGHPCASVPRARGASGPTRPVARASSSDGVGGRPSLQVSSARSRLSRAGSTPPASPLTAEGVAAVGGLLVGPVGGLQAAGGPRVARGGKWPWARAPSSDGVGDRPNQ